MNTTRDDELKPIAEGPSRRPTKEQGRQGQNIRGMVTVLVASLVLAVIGFVAVFALMPGESDPETNSVPATAPATASTAHQP